MQITIQVTTTVLEQQRETHLIRRISPQTPHPRQHQGNTVVPPWQINMYDQPPPPRSPYSPPNHPPPRTHPKAHPPPTRPKPTTTPAPPRSHKATPAPSAATARPSPNPKNPVSRPPTARDPMVVPHNSRAMGPGRTSSKGSRCTTSSSSSSNLMGIRLRGSMVGGVVERGRGYARGC